MLQMFLRLSTCLYSYMDIVEVTCRPTFQSDPYLCFPLYNIIWGFVWRLIMSYEPLCLCGKSRITRNISKKQMEMALMMMMLMKKKKISWSIRFLSLTITQCTSSRVRPSSSHQKTEERGKQQMTRKIDKTWGCRIAKSTLTGLVRLFFQAWKEQLAFTIGFLAHPVWMMWQVYGKT